MSGIKCLKPLTITDAILTASNVPEDDYPAWASGTTYAVGDYVIRTATHRVYRRLLAGAGTTAPESDALNWLDVGATNRWRCFDQSNTTTTTHAGTITYTITPGVVVGAVAFVNATAASITVEVSDPVDGVIYSKTVDMQAPPTSADWFSYVFDPINTKTLAIFEGLPSYRTGVINITVTAASGNASLGVLLLGSMLHVGMGVRQGAQLSVTDYSRKEQDDFGNYTIVRRGFSKKASYDAIMDNADIDRIIAALADLRSIACLWIGSARYESSVIYGFYKDFSVVIAYVNHSQVSLSIEGLT